MTSLTLKNAVALGVLLLSLTGCASLDRERTLNPDPNDRLDLMLGLYHRSLASGSACAEIWHADKGTVDCERILREVERLQVEFPGNDRITMANAVMNFQAGQLDKSRFLLDQLLARRGGHPDAAILRSRIAMEQGNTNLARDMLKRQILLAPGHVELQEALAASYYLEGKYDQSMVHLGIARRLGAPGWRLSYHQGLVSEARRQWPQACRFYRVTRQHNPDFMPARARLVGLSAHAACQETTIGPSATEL